MNTAFACKLDVRLSQLFISTSFALCFLVILNGQMKQRSLRLCSLCTLPNDHTTTKNVPKPCLVIA